MRKDICLDMIICLLKAHRTEENAIYSDSSCIRGAHYLLGQVVRQYAIPEENYYISEKANNLWKKISNDNIWNYVYTNKFVITDKCSLPKYVGAEKNPREIKEYQKGEKIEFNSVFHDEHIISIEVIIKQLDAIPKEKLDYDSVKKILDSIVICRILKEEDKKLQHKRFDTFKENFEKIYEPNGIILQNAREEYMKRNRKDI